MTRVVKIKVDDDGMKVRRPKWHYSFTAGGGRTAFCTGEFYGFGESGCEYEEKEGNITCQDCRDIIKKIKAIKL